MNLKNILVGIEGIKAKGDINIEINSVKNDSRKVEKGDLFISIKGYEADGADYIGDAIEKGAIAVLVEEGTNLKELKIKEDTTLIVVPDSRKAMAQIACNYYDNPSRKFQLIGITGTKGKTTTTYMVKSMLEKKGLKVGLIGTIRNYIGAESLGDSQRTTPESLELQEIFAKMAEAKCDVVIMEVSSQSLKLNRVYGSDFNIGIFTNLSEEHISEKEHADMKEPVPDDYITAQYPDGTGNPEYLRRKNEYDLYTQSVDTSALVNTIANFDKLISSMVQEINNVFCPEKVITIGGKEYTVLDTDKAPTTTDGEYGIELFTRDFCDRYTVTNINGTDYYVRNNINTFVNKFSSFLSHLILVIIGIDIIHFKQFIDIISTTPGICIFQ